MGNTPKSFWTRSPKSLTSAQNLEILHSARLTIHLFGIQILPRREDDQVKRFATGEFASRGVPGGDGATTVEVLDQKHSTRCKSSFCNLRPPDQVRQPFLADEVVRPPQETAQEQVNIKPQPQKTRPAQAGRAAQDSDQAAPGFGQRHPPDDLPRSNRRIVAAVVVTARGQARFAAGNHAMNDEFIILPGAKNNHIASKITRCRPYINKIPIPKGGGHARAVIGKGIRNAPPFGPTRQGIALNLEIAHRSIARNREICGSGVRSREFDGQYHQYCEKFAP